MTARLDDADIERLTQSAARWTGFSMDAILPDAIRRAAVQLMRAGAGAKDVLLRAARDDHDVVHALCQAVSVGETFFFRHPEHFRFIAATFLPEMIKAGRKTIRAWSAGCATGEEAYSIAACLFDLMPSIGIEVVGSDLLERNLVAARAAVYGAWSRRPSGPLLHPLFKNGEGVRLSVDDSVRAVTTFQLHNLLEPTEQKFDLIFCRNVLVYFSPEAVRTAVGHLARALNPGGALVFGSMDVSEPPPGLVSAGLPELQIFRKQPPPQARKAPPAPAPAPVPRYVPRVALPEPVALHLRALVHIERGDKKTAERELSELARLVPEYVPGILERALLQVRLGDRAAAATLMREVLRRTKELGPDELVAGPEPLPASFYRDSAETFLRAGRGGLE